jgi:hypothetical protein
LADAHVDVLDYRIKEKLSSPTAFNACRFLATMVKAYETAGQARWLTSRRLEAHFERCRKRSVEWGQLDQEEMGRIGQRVCECFF